MKLRDMMARAGSFPAVILFLIGFYLFLVYLLPTVGGWLASDDWGSVRRGLPSSGHEVPLYLTLAAFACYCYLTFDEGRWQASLAPIWSFLNSKTMARNVVLATVPLLVGVGVFLAEAAGPDEPTFNPLRHPTPPDAFSKLTNPYRHPSDELLEAFDEAITSGTIVAADSAEPLVREYGEALQKGEVSEAERAAAFERRAIEEGRNLFMINCRPCHGTKVFGDGPMSIGQRRVPADFTGVETIATLVEGAVFWRVKQGGVKLPREGAPWESAMPRWETDLSDEEIWKIIMAEYDLAGNRPREPEAIE